MQVIEDLDEIEQAVSEYQKRATGLLKISSPNLLGELHIVPAVADFLADNPKLEIELNFYGRKVDSSRKPTMSPSRWDQERTSTPSTSVWRRRLSSS